MPRKGQFTAKFDGTKALLPAKPKKVSKPRAEKKASVDSGPQYKKKFDGTQALLPAKPKKTTTKKNAIKNGLDSAPVGIAPVATVAIATILPKKVKAPRAPKNAKKVANADSTVTVQEAVQQQAKITDNVLQCIQPIIKSPIACDRISNLAATGTAAPATTDVAISVVAHLPAIKRKSDGKSLPNTANPIVEAPVAKKKKTGKWDKKEEQHMELMKQNAKTREIQLDDKHKEIMAKSRTGKKHENHGEHLTYLLSGNFDKYVQHYLKCIKHNGPTTNNMLDYLKENYDNKKYYSTLTRRFRKL